jgi:hypothetical protein
MFSSSIVDFLYPNCECSCLGCVMSYPKAQFASLNHHASQALDELNKAAKSMQHAGAALASSASPHQPTNSNRQPSQLVIYGK